jgi:DNA-binding beta-propeller fold protein YncE
MRHGFVYSCMWAVTLQLALVATVHAVLERTPMSTTRMAMGGVTHLDQPCDLLRLGSDLFSTDIGSAENGLRRVNLDTEMSVAFDDSIPRNAVSLDNHGGTNVMFFATLTKIYRVTDMSTLTATLIAGATSGYVDAAVGTDARFREIQNIRVHQSTGAIYVADMGGSTIRVLTPAGAEWVVTTLAGQADTPGHLDGSGTAAQFTAPRGLAFDGDTLYVSTLNSIRRVDVTTGVVTTAAGDATSGSVDGTGVVARFTTPRYMLVTGGIMFITEQARHTVRAMNLISTEVWTVLTLGGATATKTGITYPSGLAIDASGRNLFVTNTITHTTSVTQMDGFILKLTFNVAPLSFVSEVIFAPAFRVALVDNAGNVCTDTTPTVTVALTSGTGILAGALITTGTTGVAQFTDLSTNLVGTDKVMTFVSGALALATEEFRVTPGPPVRLALQ